MIKVSSNEYRRRSHELHNYKKVLYPQLKERSDQLRVKNKELKEENIQLKTENKERDKQIEKLQLEIEELKAMKFRIKWRIRKKEKAILWEGDKQKEEKTKKPRSPESYRRAEPKPEEVNGEIKHEISCCPDCGLHLTKKEEHVHYREDLEELEVLLQQAKRVTRRIIESGYCRNCKKRKTKVGIEIPKQKVEVGLNTKAMIVYLHILLGLSYGEIKNHLKSQYNMNVSEGQISKSLEEHSDLLRPYYQDIYDKLQSEKGCHYDETSWKVQGASEGNYAWVKTGTESNKTIFWFGRSRGKGVAERLRGDITQENVRNQTGVSDDYGVYRNIFKNHQLCWAHPNRKIRDLAKSSVLKKTKSKHCQRVYKNFAELYKDAQTAKEKFDSGGYKNKKEKLKEEKELRKRFKKITIPNNKDPVKLKNIRKSLGDRMDRYFTFLKITGIPLDNNKAERSLRKLVLKRKKSFGSKTQKGADVLSILYSVVFTIYQTYPPEEFLKRYQESLDL
jgi:transposase